jgi:uncharacterized protein YjiS (DUF1127 family)
MTALLFMLARPLLANEPAHLLRRLGACRGAIARSLARREALAQLIECDDTVLLDIGLTRARIEPAVRGRDRRS